MNVTRFSAGSHSLVATYSGDNNYFASTNQTEAQLTQVVGMVTPLLQWAKPSAIVYSAPLTTAQLNATATGINGTSLQGVFTYSPSMGAVLNAGISTLAVTFHPTDSRDYSPVSMTVPIVVDKALPLITWDSPTSMPYGTALSTTQLNASAKDLKGNPVQGAFAYSPAAGTVLNVGTHMLSVTFSPSDSQNYASAGGAVNIAVAQATPTVTWAAPAAITYGATLGTAQLDATATGVDGSRLQGTYTYNPALGTLLNAGTHMLSVTFTPDEHAGLCDVDQKRVSGGQQSKSGHGMDYNRTRSQLEHRSLRRN